jgi:prepilin-type N-terminal cleavage/methylation domain-containing protein
MRLNIHNSGPSRLRQSGLTLLELMVAMSVLTFIIFGLYTMFDRTQKAFLSSTTQTDVLEGGRSFMDMMVRDLEQARPSNISGRTNLYIAPIYINGYPINGFRQNSMTGSNMFTNSVQEFYFLTKTSAWTSIAYLVSSISTNAADYALYTNLGIGTLRRYSYTTNDFYHRTTDLYAIYTNSTANQSQRVVDGVVHLSLKAYDQNGNYVDTTGYSFTNTFMPAWLELEVGVLEYKVLVQARSIPDPAVQRSFLQETTNRASAVHLFKHRIPVRNAF